MRKVLYLIMLGFLLPLQGLAGNNKGTQHEARELFNKIYDMVFGPGGSSLSYSVNIIGLYKTQGDAIYKNHKIYYEEQRFAAWEDGKVAYMVDKRDKKVDIHDFTDDKKDKYLSMFKYDVNNFDYSYKDLGEYYELTAKVKNSKFFGIRYVTAQIRKSNLHPVSLTIKLAFISTTVQITNFHSGDIDDSVFRFPKEKFTDYQFVDHRGK